MKRHPSAAVVLALALAVVGGWSTPALADATVHVQVRSGPPIVDGTVTLTAAGRAFTCHTTQGTCTINGVPGGPATATFTPDGGQPTAPRPVMIGPSGDVNLILPSGR